MRLRGALRPLRRYAARALVRVANCAAPLRKRGRYAALSSAHFHVWFWDGQEHVDPAKEANAQEKRLLNKTTTLATEYARQGKDWETELRQIAKERTLMKELGIDDVPTADKDSKNDEGEEDGKDE